MTLTETVAKIDAYKKRDQARKTRQHLKSTAKKMGLLTSDLIKIINKAYK